MAVRARADRPLGWLSKRIEARPSLVALMDRTACEYAG